MQVTADEVDESRMAKERYQIGWNLRFLSPAIGDKTDPDTAAVAADTGPKADAATAPLAAATFDRFGTLSPPSDEEDDIAADDDESLRLKLLTWAVSEVDSTGTGVGSMRERTGA